MSLYQRKPGGSYHVEVEWRGYPRLRLSTATTIKARAKAMERTLYALRSAGRRDILGLLAAHRLALPDVHDDYSKDPGSLQHRIAELESPALGPLVDRWLAWLRSPAGVSLRTKRRYAPRSVDRYAVSWEGFFAALPKGRKARLADVRRGFVLDYRRTRKRATGGRRRLETAGEDVSAATLNRDLAALGAFLTWIRDVEGLHVEPLKMPRERESRGRERWLSREELARFRDHCPAAWWSFFATLFYTGARLGEVQGLRGGDVLLHAKRILIHEEVRRVKTKEAVRDLPIATPLERVLSSHLARVGPGPDDLVFPEHFQNYKAIRRAWDSTCAAAEVAGATPHDARHTFAVHAAQAGIPIVRLQKLLGHSDPTMTMRYMKHAPEAYMDQDAAAIAAQMAGAVDLEATARSDAARRELKPA